MGFTIQPKSDVEWLAKLISVYNSGIVGLSDFIKLTKYQFTRLVKTSEASKAAMTKKK